MFLVQLDPSILDFIQDIRFYKQFQAHKQVSEKITYMHAHFDDCLKKIVRDVHKYCALHEIDFSHPAVLIK